MRRRMRFPDMIGMSALAVDPDHDDGQALLAVVERDGAPRGPL